MSIQYNSLVKNQTCIDTSAKGGVIFLSFNYKNIDFLIKSK